VLDSRSVSVAQGLIVREAARAARGGGTLAEVLAIADAAASRARLYAAMPSLDALVKGGRVTAGQRALANALGVGVVFRRRPGESPISGRPNSRPVSPRSSLAAGPDRTRFSWRSPPSSPRMRALGWWPWGSWDRERVDGPM
jgi:hypothetical protein